MAKYTGPACKLCRREGEKIIPQGRALLYSQMCIRAPWNFAPGQHGRPAVVVDVVARVASRIMPSSLRAKQKSRRIYGIYEAQFRRYYGKALKARGITGLMLLQILNPAWIMWSSVWALHPAAPRHACW